MSAKAPKNLYVCKKFDDLKDHYNVNEKYTRQPVRRVLESAIKVSTHKENMFPL